MINKKILGNYLNQVTFFHRVNPILKIVVFSIISIIVILIPKLEILAISSGILIVFIFLSKIDFKEFIGSIKPVLTILIWALLLQLIFSSDGEVILDLKIFELHDRSVINSFIALFRFFILIGMASIMTLTTSAMEITHAFEDIMWPLKKVGVPTQDIALVLSIALRFIPIFFEESERIKNAQASKGWDIEDLGKWEKIKFYSHILIPLFNSAISRAEDLANAMEIKGYSLKYEKTRLREYKFGKEDIVFSLVSVLYIVLIIR